MCFKPAGRTGILQYCHVCKYINLKEKNKYTHTTNRSTQTLHNNIIQKIIKRIAGWISHRVIYCIQVITCYNSKIV